MWYHQNISVTELRKAWQVIWDRGFVMAENPQPVPSERTLHCSELSSKEGRKGRRYRATWCWWGESCRGASSGERK